MFVDASVIIAILNEEPGFQELEKLLEGESKLYVSPIVKFEAVNALTALYAGSGNADTFDQARAIVDEFIEAMGAREIAIDGKVGRIALDAMGQFGKLAGHPAALNLGDCFSYGAAKTYRLKLAYKGDDFSQTDIA